MPLPSSNPRPSTITRAPNPSPCVCVSATRLPARSATLRCTVPPPNPPRDRVVTCVPSRTGFVHLNGLFLCMRFREQFVERHLDVQRVAEQRQSVVPRETKRLEPRVQVPRRARGEAFPSKRTKDSKRLQNVRAAGGKRRSPNAVAAPVEFQGGDFTCAVVTQVLLRDKSAVLLERCRDLPGDKSFIEPRDRSIAGECLEQGCEVRVTKGATTRRSVTILQQHPAGCGILEQMHAGRSNGVDLAAWC